ncbi:hypothetical protein NLG97_g11265 [Lecanicillium saksenae]|uniref:Uncharacterized protein n=1 Tax=Lecanicillium saksenae TaxID=468837 RepID=A0ACC1QD96_9HYPO|nr:hypothetical protein NLG97_g11265 [Lecanicillium saksenae]
MRKRFRGNMPVAYKSESSNGPRADADGKGIPAVRGLIGVFWWRQGDERQRTDRARLARHGERAIQGRAGCDRGGEQPKVRGEEMDAFTLSPVYTLVWDTALQLGVSDESIYLQDCTMEVLTVACLESGSTVDVYKNSTVYERISLLKRINCRL